MEKVEETPMLDVTQVTQLYDLILEHMSFVIKKSFALVNNKLRIVKQF